MESYSLMTDIHDLSTPSLIVDKSRLNKNIARMKARADTLGVMLRPHLKTVKSAKVARLAVGEGGGAVSTLREAEYFSEAGFTDLVWAVCATPDKLDRAAGLVEKGVQLTLVTDSLWMAQRIRRHPCSFRAWIEIDCGAKRTGIEPDNAELLRVAEALGDRGCGLMTHAGHSYAASSLEEIRRIAEQERDGVTTAAARLQAAGFDYEHVSVGSTPTAAYVESLEGVTELRPGVYMFGDLFQSGIGACRFEDQALSVLSTVISVKAGQIVLDAGGLALSKDRSTMATSFDAGYGLVCDLSGQCWSGGSHISEVHQEHGIVRDAPEGVEVGEKVRILVNHACMTAAAYPGYHIIDQSQNIIDYWERCNGW